MQPVTDNSRHPDALSGLPGYGLLTGSPNQIMNNCEAYCYWRSLSLSVSLGIGILMCGGQAGLSEEPIQKPIVYFGGFAFAGNASEIPVRYPISNALNIATDDGTPLWGRKIREFFQTHRDLLTRVNLEFGVARKEDTSLVLALAMTEEQVLKEKIGNFNKLVIELGFELVVLDYRGMEVVSSQPVFIELIDAAKEPFSDEQISERIRKMTVEPDSQLLKSLADRCARVQIRGKNQGTLQVKGVSIGEKALPFLPAKYLQGTNTYAQLVAQEFGALLSSQAGVSLLPFAKDAANTKMALVFSDASVLQFAIPAPTFAIDLGVRGFKKVLDKSMPAEALWLYGAFLDLKVYEPEFQQIYFEKPIKFGVSKIVPISQKEVDEYPVVSEALKGAFLEAINQMCKDKNTQTKVISKCKL